MKLAHLCAAFALAFAVLLPIGAIDAPAAAQTVSDAGVYHLEQMPPNGPEDFRPDGVAEFGWGNALLALLQSDLILGLLGTGLLWLIARTTGKSIEADDATRYREYLRSAYNFGLNAVEGVVAGRKLTVKEASPVVEWVLWYAERLFPQMLSKFGGKEDARLRVWSLVDLAEGESIPMVAPTAAIAVAPAPAPAARPASPAAAVP